MAKWIEYTGSDEQIAEIKSNTHGYIVRDDLGMLSNRIRVSFDLEGISILPFEYLICEPHPYADVIDIWRLTGCEVYVCEHHNNYYDGILESTDCFYHPPTNKPNWNIPGAEYRLTPFDEEELNDGE